MFISRTVRPKKDNKYYMTVGNGGYSNCITGWPTAAGTDVLSNCVGYAVGRFNEIAATGSKFNYLYPCHACFMMNHLNGLKTGKTPKIGACMVFSGGSDGCGHVMIVEKIKSFEKGKTILYVSDSVYGGAAFRYREVKETENFGLPKNYKFMGYIYNPKVFTTKDLLEARKALLGLSKTKMPDLNGDGKFNMKEVNIIRRCL